MSAMTATQVASYIDHTILKANAVTSEVDKLCKEAAEHKFMSVCVNPSWVPYCSEKLKGTRVKVCTVIGFPLGATSTASKAFEAEHAVKEGATEIDMVINIGWVKDAKWDMVKKDVVAVVEASKKASNHIVVKVILETCLLTDEQIVKVSEICKEAKADFVKTSTGFSTAGATAHHVSIMRATVGPDMGVKASGGIRDYASAMAMINAGANRLGCSSGVAIVSGSAAAGTGY